MRLGTDKQLVKERFEANFGRYDRLASVQQQICAQVAKLMEQLRIGDPGRAMEIGAGTGFLTSRLAAMFPSAEWYLNDIAPAAGKYVAKYLAGTNHTYLWGDAEEIEFPAGLDLIATASTVQWFDDIAAFAAKTAAAVNPGGWLVLSSFGPENFREISATTGEGLDYFTLDQYRNILENAGYSIAHASEQTESLHFDSPRDVLHHIKATGVNSVRQVRWGRGRLLRFEEDYRQLFTTVGGKVSLTYHPIITVARKI